MVGQEATGWWRGVTSYGAGFFPGNYVEEVAAPASGNQKKYSIQALYDFSATDNASLSFQQVKRAC